MSLHSRKNNNLIKDFVVIIYPNGVVTPTQILRDNLTNKQDKIKEAKQIAAKLIDCELVDGVNIEINGKYYGGLYCDDRALYSQFYNCHVHTDRGVLCGCGTLVLINELEGIAPEDLDIIVPWLKDHIEVKGGPDD